MKKHDTARIEDFPEALGVCEALAEANRAAADGAPERALDILAAANRREKSIDLERRMIALRAEIFARGARSVSLPERGDPTKSLPIDPSLGLPSVAPDELDAAVLANTLAKHGALVCKGLVSPTDAEMMRETMDRAWEARAAFTADRTDGAPWYEPGPHVNSVSRAFTARGGVGMITCDSPRGLSRLMDLYRKIGILDLLRQRLGDEVFMLAEKCVMRRVEPAAEAQWEAMGPFLSNPDAMTIWHQDAYIIDSAHLASSVLDVWISLTPSGADAPGLEIVPTSLERLLPTIDGKPLRPLSDAILASELPDFPPALPALDAGDAVLFDQFTVHGTSFRRHMSQRRYSIEGWFFAGKAFPKSQKGLFV